MTDEEWTNLLDDVSMELVFGADMAGTALYQIGQALVCEPRRTRPLVDWVAAAGATVRRWRATLPASGPEQPVSAGLAPSVRVLLLNAAIDLGYAGLNETPWRVARSLRRVESYLRRAVEKIRAEAKPPEPVEVGAMVEDADEAWWVLTEPGQMPGATPWLRVRSGGIWANYADIDVRRIVFEDV